MIGHSHLERLVVYFIFYIHIHIYIYIIFILYVYDFYYLGSLLGVTLEYHLNSLCLMYQQHTAPAVSIWSNLILDLYEYETSKLHESLNSNYSKLTFLLMYQTNTIPIMLKGDH